MTTDTTVELDGQYRLLRQEAGSVDRPGRTKLVVGGADAAEFLQGQLTNEIEGLEPGSGCYSALLDRKGHLQADMRVLRLEDGALWIDGEAEGGPALVRHLTTYRIGREVELTDVTGEQAIVSVIGPAAAHATGAGPLPAEHAHRAITIAGVAGRAVATDLGIDVICAGAEAPELLAALESAGAPTVSEAAAEVLRVESGRPRFGHDMSVQTMPEEAGINERAVDFSKGCYIGQETVARLHYRGRPNRHLRGIRLERPAEAGDSVRLGERELGHVGTAVLSPALGPIALAILRREAEPGARVEVGEPPVGGEIVELPFVHA